MTDDGITARGGQGTGDCEVVRPRLADLARGEVDPAIEDSLKAHLAGCRACRAALAEADPASLFLELRGRSLPSGFWREFDLSLRARLEQEKQAGWRWSWAWEGFRLVLRPPRVAYFAAPLAMVFALGVTLYVTRPGLLAPGPQAQRPGGGQRSPYAQLVTPRRGAAGPRAEREPAVDLVAPPELAAAEPPPLEEVRSPAARVYRLDVAGEDPTPIYMVVDETIEF